MLPVLVPDKPTVVTLYSTTDTIVINGSGVSTPSNSNFDLFSVVNISPDSTPTFDRATTGSKNTSDHLEVSGLASGTEYVLQVVTEVGTHSTPCSSPNQVDSDVTNVTYCTCKLTFATLSNVVKI